MWDNSGTLLDPTVAVKFKEVEELQDERMWGLTENVLGKDGEFSNETWDQVRLLEISTEEAKAKIAEYLALLKGDRY